MSNNFNQSKKKLFRYQKYTNFKVFPLIQLISRTNSAIDSLFIFYISNMFFYSNMHISISLHDTKFIFNFYIIFIKISFFFFLSFNFCVSHSLNCYFSNKTISISYVLKKFESLFNIIKINLMEGLFFCFSCLPLFTVHFTPRA